MGKKEAQRRVLILMACSLALRIFTATSIELGNDEVYYWLYPRYLSWSYFDHPAMIAWVVRLLNFGQPVQAAWALRLPALVFGTANIYIAFLLGSRLKSALCGYYASLLYASSIYVSVICGVFILPDTAQSFFWLLSLLCLVNLFADEEPASKTAHNRTWLLFGLCAGLAVLSKYHGVFLWAGAGLYILISARKELRNPYLYLAALISLVCLFPILYWNSQHQWASFAYHGKRTLEQGPLVHWDNVLQQILGEWFYNSLWVVALIVAAMTGYVRKPFLEKRKFVLLMCMSLPLIIFVWVMSGTRETLPHWTGPSYLALMLLPAAWLESKRRDRPKPGTPRVLWLSVGMTALLMICGIMVVNNGIPGKKNEADTPSKELNKDDFTLDMYGWEKTKQEADSALSSLVQKGELSPGYQFLQVNWFNGAHLDFYVARPLGKKTLVLGPLKDIHQYYWVNQHQEWDGVKDYCFVTNSREYQELNRLPAFFTDHVTRTDTLSIYRNGRLAEAVFLTICRNVPVDSVHAYVYPNELP